MGFIYLLYMGYYIFYLDVYVYVEFWLSKKLNIMDVELVVKIVKENKKILVMRFVSYILRKMYFEKGKKYFFDVFYVMNGGMM